MSRSKTTRSDSANVTEPEFISRWSRLKHQAKQDSSTPADRTAISEEARENPGQSDHKAVQSARILTDADMPDLDSLTPDSVYSDFLSPGVSEKLRKLALRKLFHSEDFNIRDGLDEYDGDYTQFEKLGGIVTADMQHQFEMEARRKAQQLVQGDDEAVEAESVIGGVDEDRRQLLNGQTTGNVSATEQAPDKNGPCLADTADAGEDVERVGEQGIAADAGKDHG